MLRPSLVAVMVAVSPLVPPVTENVGVVSAVMLSVVEVPVSDAAARSGALGAEGGVSITSGRAALGVEVLPAGSVSVLVTLQVPSVSAGSVQDVATPMV